MNGWKSTLITILVGLLSAAGGGAIGMGATWCSMSGRVNDLGRDMVGVEATQVAEQRRVTRLESQFQQINVQLNHILERLPVK